MDLNLEMHLAAVERSVSASERDGHPVRSISMSRSFRATLEDLWDAVTSADRIPRWFLPVSGDLQAGGRYQLEGNAGGTITDCARLSHFSLTWEFGGDVSWVEVDLAGEGIDRARLTSLAHLLRVGALGHVRGRRRGRWLGDGAHGACHPP